MIDRGVQGLLRTDHPYTLPYYTFFEDSPAQTHFLLYIYPGKMSDGRCMLNIVA